MQLKMFDYEGNSKVWFPSLARSYCFDKQHYVRIGTTKMVCDPNEKINLKRNLEIVGNKITPLKRIDGRCIGIFQLLSDDYAYSENVGRIYLEVVECESCKMIETIVTKEFLSASSSDDPPLAILQFYLIAQFDNPNGFIKVRVMKIPPFWLKESKKEKHDMLDCLTLTVEKTSYVALNP